jgi:DNA replication and repair protein RecF
VRITQLRAQYFRNLDISEVQISKGVTIIHGNNAQGKTNLLEAVYFCALGRPLRGANSRDFVPVGIAGKEVNFAHVNAQFCDDNEKSFSYQVDARIVEHNGKFVKAISIDNIPIKNTRELFGRVPVVSFSPEDLQLIKAGPGARRRFVDIELCQLSKVYYNDLQTYTQALHQRNHLLKLIKRDTQRESELDVWDEQLSAAAVRVMHTRSVFIKDLAQKAQDIYAQIAQKKEVLTIEYEPCAQDEQSFQQMLKKTRTRDIALGTTGSGTHREDIYFGLKGRSARSFGSQGQQRSAALAVKLAEIALIHEKLKTLPILLLDDVFSELDTDRRKYLLEHLKSSQVIITCTGLDDIIKNFDGECNILYMNNGGVTA